VGFTAAPAGLSLARRVMGAILGFSLVALQTPR